MAQKVLIADDDQVVHEALGIYLKAEGFEVVDAFDGVSAIESITPEVVLCVLDIMMPKMSGIEVLAILKEDNPAMGAIMLTGYPTVETAREAISLGADEYCVKPIDRSELEDKVEKVLTARAGR